MIKVKVVGIEKLERMGIHLTGTRQRLLYDLTEASKKFGNESVYFAKTKYLRGPRPEKILSKKLLRSRINTKTVQEGNIISTSVGSDVIYAAIQELGGETHPPLTKKMRAFAWAMFYETGEEMWKRMALSKKNRLTIKIPPRPFIRPAMNDAMPSFMDNITRILGKVSFMDKSDVE